MSDRLSTLHEYAVELRRLGMLQSAGDFDYLVAWLRSPEFNNGSHLQPHPAGKNTVDAYSNNCPIPFTPGCSLIKNCRDKHTALVIVQLAKDLITELLSIYTDDIEQTAINAYLEYTSDVIVLLGGEEPGPIPPVYPMVYINSTIDERAIIYSDEDQTKTIAYNVAKDYTVINWYDENGTSHPFANDIILDRCPESDLPGTVCAFNQTGNPVFVQYIEYELETSNKLQGCFASDSGEIAKSTTVQPEEYAVVCAMDTSDPDNLLAVPVLYENFFAYTGGRYRNQSNAFINMSSSGLEFRKEYDAAIGEYVLVVYNSTSSAITIKDFEYSKSEAHVLNIVAPSNVVGVSCTINAIYDATAVTPEWTVSPSGPTISGDTLTFIESGEYTLQASYNGLVATKQINVDYKTDWSTTTIIYESGDYPVATTTITDDSENKESEIVTYIDGEPVNTGFEIEPGNKDIPVTIDEGKDTKIYTFDGTNGFELFFKFYYDPSLQPPPDYADKPGETDKVKHFTVLNMKYEVPPYPGIVIRQNENDKDCIIHASVTPIGSTSSTKVAFIDTTVYDIYIRYEPSAPFEKFVILQTVDGVTSVVSKSDQYTYEFSNNITTTLGYVNAGTQEEPIVCRQSIFDVYDFRLNKILYPWKDIPTITETTTHNGLLITKEITNDDDHFVKRLLIEPDPNVTSDEYVLLDDGLIFDDILPFMDSNQIFEFEFDIKASYEDQIPYSGDFQILISMIPEIQNHWPGFCVRLAKNGRPSSSKPDGQVDYRLRYTNDRSAYTNSIATAWFDLDSSHIMHYRFIYEGTALRKCSALYSYSSNAYRIFTKNELYAVYPHDWPLCIGCALDENRQKFRECKMYIKKIEYIRKIK